MPTPFANGADLKGRPIINLGAPAADTDAVTKAYVDAAIRGLDWKSSVRAAASGNITLTGPGGVIDDVTLAVGDRVLLLGQTGGAENGIWIFNGATVAMTRAPDADSSAEVTSGMAVTATEGTANGDKVFVLTTNDPITLGTTALTFVQVGSASTPYTAGNGLQLIGQAFSVLLPAGSGLIADTTGLRIDTALVGRKAAFNVGDGTATSYVVTHNFGSLDVSVTLVEAANGQQWIPDVSARATNSVTLVFGAAPAANAFRAIIQA